MVLARYPTTETIPRKRAVEQLGPDLFCFADTCRVYVLRSGREATLVDFGSGDVLHHLAALGVERVTDVLMTHHHRDQGQGLARAVQAGARIWAPHAEQDLFAAVDQHWQARPVYNDYNMRQDRFSLLEPVPLAGTLRDYETRTFGAWRLAVVPTPGHTTGSITLLAEMEGRRLAFTGDLIAEPGKLWSLAATQWTYNGAEGVAASIASLLDLRDRAPDVLLPSHGRPMAPAGPAIDLLVERLWRLLCERGQSPHLLSWREQPFTALTPHLLYNRTSEAHSYVLLSDSGQALIVDLGYDFCTGLAAGTDRASRRPWLYTLPALKRQFGVNSIEVAVPTHYHDDHVAGLNLLRDVEGTQIWAAESFADILEQPWRYDLPCLWYDPIPVDRRLPLGQPVTWREYELMLYPQPGHTRFAAAIQFEVDGLCVLASGDQYEGDAGCGWNYVYRNHFDGGDYKRTAGLYRCLAPDLIVSGHWEPLRVPPGYLDQLAERGAVLEELHGELLADHTVDGEDGGPLLRLEPYQADLRAGESSAFVAVVRNPWSRAGEAVLRPVLPAGWTSDPASIRLCLAAGAVATAVFCITPPPGTAVRRARIAVDASIGGQYLGQQAEALATVVPGPRGASAGDKAWREVEAANG